MSMLPRPPDNLPKGNYTGIENFALGSSNPAIYVDKTELFYRFVRKGGVYGFFRPRRFGKTLLSNTIVSLLRHGLESFSGTWLGNHPEEWTLGPQTVVRFDFSPITLSQSITSSDAARIEFEEHLRLRIKNALIDAGIA